MDYIVIKEEIEEICDAVCESHSISSSTSYKSPIIININFERYCPTNTESDSKHPVGQHQAEMDIMSLIYSTKRHLLPQNLPA
jgi:hypothetical protein